MSMILLTNKVNVSKFLQVAIGYKESDFNKFIEEAQTFDFKELVCEEFYYDLLKKKDEEAWKKLIDGGKYTYNERTYYFKGIADVIAYFTFARFILKAPVVSASHGFVIKETPHSKPLSLEERRNFYYSHRKDANTLFEDTKKFIERNISDFESWNCDSDCSPKITSSFNTTVIQ
ncbi:hypothetical protein V2605_03455 [Tenacibaculum maritimum]|uniref:DUF6712 family protein n=2 Tax=Tenacibaculum maritimum TaxID=107401 RepID=UPI00132FDB8E|nr:hypothetical protein [Tenacibaculum maritimum]